MIEHLLFWTCCLLVVSGALGAALVRNLFHAALLLGLCLAGIAGLYLFLEAAYLACIQVVVYIGGILVLLLFATLFSADIMGKEQRQPGLLVGAGVIAAALAGFLAWRISAVSLAHASDLASRRSQPGSMPDVIGGAGMNTMGDLLVGPWLVPFLLASLLLTVALVGAVATVKRFRNPLEVPRG